MSISYKPAGYSTVSPYLLVKGGQEVIDFLKTVFNATPLRRYERPDGSIMHAEVNIEGSVIMLGEVGAQGGAVPAHLHVYVRDADAVYKRALAAGGISVQPPAQKEDDPDRRGGVQGPGGNTWWISTQVDAVAAGNQ